jgi:membrane protease YdiL (CAAX protease family)
MEPGQPTAQGTWACPACRERVPAQFDLCWNCETARGDVEVTLYTPSSAASIDAASSSASTDEQTSTASIAIESIASPTARSRGEIWLEVCVVLAVAWFAYFVSSLFPNQASEEQYSFVAFNAWFIINSIPIIAVVLYIMYRSEMPWAFYGIKRVRLLLDPLAGMLTYVAAVVLLGMLYGLISTIWNTDSPAELGSSGYEFQYPSTAADIASLLLMAIFIGLSEELAMRSYLIPRFEQLLKSTRLSVLLSSFFFASYHLYQGIGPAISIFIVGLVFGAGFCWQRRLWPVAIAHTVMDITAFLQRDLS